MPSSLRNRACAAAVALAVGATSGTWARAAGLPASTPSPASAPSAASTPAVAPTPAAAEAQALFEKASRYFRAQEYAPAIADLQQAYILDPQPEYLYALAQAERLSGDCTHAIVAYEQYAGASGADPARASIARAMIDECRKTLAARAPAGAPAVSSAPAISGPAAQNQALEARLAQDEARAAEQDRERRLAEAGEAGHGLRVTGVIVAAAGGVAMALSFIPLADGMHQRSLIDQFNQNPAEEWGNKGALPYQVADTVHQDGILWAALLGGGAALAAAGVTFYALGVHDRSEAEDAVPPVTVTPAIGPTGAALTLGGAF